MAFDNNVTRNLFWYNSKPHSCVWNFTFSACKLSVLHFVRDHLRVPFSLRTLEQWQPLAALPTSSGSFLVPTSVTWGTQVLISHTSGRGQHWCHPGAPCALRLESGHCNNNWKRKNLLFLRAWANKLTLSKCFRGLLKILPLACWKTTRETENFLPLLVQCVYIFIVWNIYIYIVLQLVFPRVHSNKLCCYFEAF